MKLVFSLIFVLSLTGLAHGQSKAPVDYYTRWTGPDEPQEAPLKYLGIPARKVQTAAPSAVQPRKVPPQAPPAEPPITKTRAKNMMIMMLPMACPLSLPAGTSESLRDWPTP